MALLLFEGDARTSRLNRDLGLEAARYGSRVIWLASQPDQELPTLVLPFVDENVRPLVEIFPLQLLTLVMAAKNGFEPGGFRHVGKVTVEE